MSTRTDPFSPAAGRVQKSRFRAVTLWGVSLSALGLVLCAWWGFGLPSIAGVVLGHIAVRTNRDGRPLPALAVALGYIGLTLSLIMFTVFLAVGLPAWNTYWATR